MIEILDVCANRTRLFCWYPCERMEQLQCVILVHQKEVTNRIRTGFLETEPDFSCNIIPVSQQPDVCSPTSSSSGDPILPERSRLRP